MKSILFIFLVFFANSSNSNTIVFIDNSVSNDTYIASNKERQISIAYHLGQKYLNKTCNLSTKQLIGKEPLSVFTQAKEVNSILGDKIIIGLIHSSEALLAAEAFKQSKIISLSSGAATDLLNKKNDHFFSLANPIESVSTHVQNYIKKNKIVKPVAIIPGNSSYSVELAKSLKDKLDSTSMQLEIIMIDTSKEHSNEISKRLTQTSYDFIYAPGFLQQTLPIFESISKTSFRGVVYGSANLARSKTDLQLFSASLNLRNLNIKFPATWMSGETNNSKELEKIFLKENKEEIMGTAVYTYDATIIAGSFLCSHYEKTPAGFINYIENYVLTGRIPTARKYLSLSNGHLISTINTVQFNHRTRNLDIDPL